MCQAFTLIDPSKRKTRNSIYLFREFLLKKFVKCYDMSDYSVILEQFEAFSKLNDTDLPVTLENYQMKDAFLRCDPERF